MIIHFSFSTKIVDTEMAFLYGDHKEEIYMEFPQRMFDEAEMAALL